MKTEPTLFSYDTLETQKCAVWDGVRNNQALMHIRAMKKGDHALIYHTGKVQSLVGLAEVVSDPYPDPTGGNPRFVVVDVAPAGRLPKPVSLAMIKADAAFSALGLVRFSRLSVMPVSPGLWRRLIGMAT